MAFNWTTSNFEQNTDDLSFQWWTVIATTYNLWKLWIFSGSMQIIAMELLFEFSRTKYFDGFDENIGKCSGSNDRLKSPSDIVENVFHLLRNKRYFDCNLVRLIKS